MKVVQLKKVPMTAIMKFVFFKNENSLINYYLKT